MCIGKWGKSMKKKNIAWLLSAAMILTTAAAPMETVSVYAAEEFQAETNEAEGTEIAEDTATETGEEVSEDSQDNTTDDLDLFEDSAEELEVDAEADNPDTEELQADAEDGFSDGEAAVASEGDSSEVVESGSCGSDATYKLYGDGRLVIEGSGNVNNYFTWIAQGDKKIKSVEIGEGITSLECSDITGVFEYCSDLTSVTLPKSLTALGNRTFFHCSNLKTIELPEGLTSIGDYVFSECESLSTVILPENLINIGKYIFQDSSLSNVSIPEKMTVISEGMFSRCRNLSNINLPDKVTKIGNFAFAECGISNIDLPETLEEIGDYAFIACYLNGIDLPENLTKIGDYTFSQCGLKSIELPENLKEIGDNAFRENAFKTVTIPDAVTNVGYGAFAGCSDLRSIKLSENLKRIGSETFLNCERLDSIVLPDSITEIGDGAFGNCGLTEIKLPPNLISIGNRAFSNNKLLNISFPEGLKTIGNEAFYSCQLSSIKLPDTVTDIGESAFYWNSNLRSINIPKNVTEIKERTFWECNSLQEITFPEGLLKIGKNAFTGTILGEVTLPDSVITIEESAFENCGLNRIKLSKNLTEIPYGAFSNCTSLTEIILPDNITHVDTNAFFNCTYLRSVYIANVSTVIEKKAFGYNSNGTKQDILIMGHKGSTAETYAAENGFSFHNIKDPLTFHAESKPTCTSDGNYQYWHCEVCSRDFCNAEGSSVVWGGLTISKLGHNLTYYAGKSATCTQSGNQSYYHCETCGKNFSDWNGETEISEKDIVIPAPGHQMEYHGKNEPNCINGGMKAYYYCTRCGQYFLNQEGTQTVAESDLILPTEPQNHTMRYIEGYEATCINEGRKSYYICDYCHQGFFDEKGTEKVTEDSELIIPVTNEHILELEQGYPAECQKPGVKDTYRCTSCGKHFLDKDGKEEVQQDSDVSIPQLGHKFTDGQWVNKGSGKHTVSKGNPTPIFFTADYQQYLKCERCGFQDWGETRTYNMSVNTDQVTLKNGQSTTAVRVSDFTNGDYLKSVTPKDTSLVTVSNVNNKGTFKLTAKNKNGSTWVTITLNSGVKTNILVTVKVTTQAITNLKSTVSVVRGKTVTLRPVLKPVTSQDKIKYSSSNKNIAAVNSKGVITGRKVGTAKITVTSGSKKFIVTVKVTKIKTTKLTGVPKTKTLSRRKTFTIKAVATPRNTDEKVTYKSSNSRIATVNSKGVVKGVRKGTAVITVQSGSKKLTCRVTVK